jgi:hypothetical protein
VVLTDSHGISRAPCYLGYIPGGVQTFRLRGLHPLWPAFQDRSPMPTLSPHQSGRTGTVCPTTPTMQPLPGITHERFSLIRVRSPLLTESLLFSLPVGTEMFHFPTFPPHTLCVQMWVTTHNRQRGFPIRTPSDQSSVINSPRIIADSYVLLRLLMPRHPPCALKNLNHKNQS